MNSAATVCGYLAAIVVGLSCGAMLTGAVVMVPFWRALPANEFLAWFAANAQRMQFFFGPLQVGAILFTIASTVLFGVAHRSGTVVFGVASVLAVAVLLTFPLYFRAANASFVDGSIPLDQVSAELARWAAWQWARTALGLAAFCMAVFAVGVSHEPVSA